MGSSWGGFETRPYEQQERQQDGKHEHLLSAEIHPVSHEAVDACDGHVKVNALGMKDADRAILTHELSRRNQTGQGRFDE
jgi:hypothetical protein